MLDIHTHLYWDSYDADRDAVVKQAREAGVKEMLVIGCTLDESRQAIGVAEQYSDMFASVGIHPHEFNKEGARYKMQAEGWIEGLRTLAQHEKVVAIGECGLDYFSHDPEKVITDEQKKFQKEGLLAQIVLAQEFDLPLIIHTRPSVGSMDAYEDILGILKANESLSWRIKAVLHCYMGDTEVTEKFLELPNVCFSFAGNITYPIKKALVGTKDDLTETVRRVPLERLFVETDCPFLAPQGHRGERNEPAFVVETADKVALLHKVTRGVVEEATQTNAARVFSH